MPRSHVSWPLAVLSLGLLLAACSKPLTTIDLPTGGGVIVGTSPQDIWLLRDRVGTTTAKLVHSSGGAFAQVSTEALLNEVAVVHNIAPAGPNAVWVAGLRQLGDAILVRVTADGAVREQSLASIFPTGRPRDAFNLNVAARADALFVRVSGHPDRLYRLVDGSFEPLPGMPESVDVGLLAVSAADDLWVSRGSVTGGRGGLARWRAGTWTAFPPEVGQSTLHSVAVASPTDIWFGEWHWDGTQMTEAVLPGSVRVSACGGTVTTSRLGTGPMFAADGTAYMVVPFGCDTTNYFAAFRFGPTGTSSETRIVGDHTEPNGTSMLAGVVLADGTRVFQYTRGQSGNLYIVLLTRADLL